MPVTIAYPIQAGSHAQLIGRNTYAANPDASVMISDTAKYIDEVTKLRSKQSAGITARTCFFVGNGGASPDSIESCLLVSVVDAVPINKMIGLISRVDS